MFWILHRESVSNVKFQDVRNAALIDYQIVHNAFTAINSTTLVDTEKETISQYASCVDKIVRPAAKPARIQEIAHHA
jgi:hypothetical protein